MLPPFRLIIQPVCRYTLKNPLTFYNSKTAVTLSYHYIAKYAKNKITIALTSKIY